MIIIKTLLLFYLINYASGRVDRIAGGKRASKGQFPFFAQLHIGMDSKGNGFQCGGSLIFPQWILTAAHCFPNSRALTNKLARKGWLVAVMGTESSFGSDGVYNIIRRVIPHPLFIIEYTDKQQGQVKRLENDIAVAFLRYPYGLTPYIFPINLPQSSLLSNKCLDGIIVGAGKTSFNSKLSQYVLYAEVHPKNLRDLISPLMVRGGSTTFYAEIQWYKGHALRGDSGGPYLCYEDQVAVIYGVCSAAYNSTSAKQTIVSVYESVEEHLDFILRYASKGYGLKKSSLETLLTAFNLFYLCYKP